MKKSPIFGLFVCALALGISGGASAQTDFAAKIQKAREVLATPLVGEKEWDKSAQRSRQNREAAQLLFEAALEEPKSQKFALAFEAGELFRREYRPEEAAKAYNLAIENPKNAPPEQLGIAALHAAKEFQQADHNRGKDKGNAAQVIAAYAKSLAVPRVLPAQKAQIHTDFGAYLERKEKFWEAAQNYEQAAILTPPDFTKSPSEQDMRFYNARTNAQKLPPSPQIRAFMEGVFERQLGVKNAAPDPKNRAYALSGLRSDYAQAMLGQNAPEKALELWKQSAADASLPFDVRYRALKNGATELSKKGQFKGAAQLWTLAIGSNQTSEFWELEAHLGLAEALAAQNKWQDARAALQKIVDSPKQSAARKEEFALEIADFWGREAASLPKNSAPQKAAIAGARAALNTLIARKDIAPKTLYGAIIERAEIESRFGSMDDARAGLLLAVGLFGEPTGYSMGLRNNVARLFLHEKKWREAIDAIPVFVRVILPVEPNTDGYEIAGKVFDGALAAKDWAAAAYAAQKMESWRGVNQYSHLRRLKIEVESGDFAAARARLPLMEKVWMTEISKKEFAALKAKIPAN